MRRHLVAALLALFASLAFADSWPNSGPRLFSDSDGRHSLKILPERGDKSATAIFFTLNDDGTDHILWQSKLVNVPVDVLISPRGKYVITLDTWAHVGYAHTLMVYDENGKVLVDDKLEDLLTPDEITAHTIESVSSHSWRYQATTTFTDGGETLLVTFPWQKTLAISLENGHVLKVEKPLILP